MFTNKRSCCVALSDAVIAYQMVRGIGTAAGDRCRSQIHLFRKLLVEFEKRNVRNAIQWPDMEIDKDSGAMTFVWKHDYNHYLELRLIETEEKIILRARIQYGDVGTAYDEPVEMGHLHFPDILLPIIYMLPCLKDTPASKLDTTMSFSDPWAPN